MNIIKDINNIKKQNSKMNEGVRYIRKLYWAHFSGAWLVSFAKTH